MKKRNIAVRLGITAMALTLVTTSLSSGTLAKYVSEEKATATVQVAKWNPEAAFQDAAGNAITLTEGAFDLRSTVLADSVKTNTLAANVIAPGTEGRFKVGIDGAPGSSGVTEVAIDYKVYIKALGGGQAPNTNHFHMWCEEKFQQGSTTEKNGTNYQHGKTSTWMEGTEDTTYGYELMSGTIPAGASGDDKVKTCTMHWLWPYESDVNGESAATADAQEDKKDTQTGAGAVTNQGQYKYQITILMVQHNPNAAVS